MDQTCAGVPNVGALLGRLLGDDFRPPEPEFEIGLQ